MPAGFIALVLALYSDCNVISRYPKGRHQKIFFQVCSGVLQGCPLSASLFVIAFNGVLSLLRDAVGVDGVAAACADDIATVTRTKAALLAVLDVFASLQRVTNLRLNVSKTPVAPLGLSFCKRLKLFVTAPEFMCRS